VLLKPSIEDTCKVKILNFSSRTLSTNRAFLAIMDVNSSSVCLENEVKDSVSNERLANLFAFHKASQFGIANAQRLYKIIVPCY